MSESSRRVDVYFYTCDRCSARSPHSFLRAGAISKAQDAGWYIGRNEHYCPGCLEEYCEIVTAAGIDLEVSDGSA